MAGSAEGGGPDSFQAVRQADDAAGEGGDFLEIPGAGKGEPEVGLDLGGDSGELRPVSETGSGAVQGLQDLEAVRVPEGGGPRVGRPVSLSDGKGKPDGLGDELLCLPAGLGESNP